MLPDRPCPPRLTFLCLTLLVLFLAVPSAIAEKPEQTKPEKAVPAKASGPTAQACALLDDPKARPIMDGLLPYLLRECGRAHELGGVSNESSGADSSEQLVGTDVPISDPSGDTGSLTQSETSMAVNPTTGTICAAHNDSYHGITEGNGFSGFARSTDGGATFVDQGAIGPNNSGDPSLVWRQVDGKFYYAALSNGGLAVWRSDDDCQSFTFVATIVNTGQDDKELMAVDNNMGGMYYGRLYVVWTNFSAGGIFATFSDDAGVTWSTGQRISSVTGGVQGAWPVVAPNGDVYAAWVRFGSGTVTMDVARSTNGGVNWNLVTSPAANLAGPEDAAATGFCGRDALNGNIRYLPSPQIAVGPNGDVHIVYSYDPDGAGPDTVDVFYRRSTDSGATWQPEIRVNDDATTTDQFYPTLSVGESNIVSVGFYDRRNDTANNLLYEYFQATSPDGGVTWLDNVKVSDVQSSVVLDGGLAACYHGDYDTHIQIAGAAIMQWSDDRNGNADTFSDIVALGTDFLLVPDTVNLQACAPNDVTVDLDALQFNAFSESVTLASSGWPAGLNAAFSPNPVTPPSTSQLTISGTAAVGFGTYALKVTGTSSPSAIVQEADLTLDVFTQVPGVPALTAPADDELNVALIPTLSWSASTQASSYTVQVATDAAFSNIVFETTTTSTSVEVDSALPSATELFWRVRSTNFCAESAYSAVFSFTTVPLPGDCLPGFTLEALFTDDFEAGAGGWTTGGTGSTWAVETGTAQSGTQAFQADNVAQVSDQYLISPTFTIPGSASPVNLLFWTRHDIEPNGANCYDGGVVEISTDGGSNWQRLESEIEIEAYDGVVDTGFSNPLGGDNAWCGVRTDWVRFAVDLAAFAGQSAQVRFRLGTDSLVARDGWWIDDVTVATCSSPDIFIDGFEAGDTTAWSASFP